MPLSQDQLRQRTKDTIESIRGKNGYKPKGLQSGGDAYWPSQNVHDLPGGAPDWRDDPRE